MLADAYHALAGTFADPNLGTGVKLFMLVAILAFAGFAWMVGKRLWGLVCTPWWWWQERQAWKALAAKAGWSSLSTRKYSGEQSGHPWRLRVHVQGAWISDSDANTQGSIPSQAQWRMRNLPWSGRVLVLPRAQDEALCQKASASQEGGGADVALAAAGLAGLILGQGWTASALDMAGGLSGAPAEGPGMERVEAGSESFRKQYVVRSDAPRLASGIISAEVESLLGRLSDPADPPNAFSVRYADGNLTLSHLGLFGDAQRAARLGELGLAMARAQGEVAGNE